MITYIRGDLFNSPAQVLVNTVNTVGVMGKGIALDFKNRYPDMFKEYQKICDKNLLEISKLLLWKNSDKWVLLFPTKEHWRSSSKLSYIEDGLKKFVKTYEKLGIESIAFPKLGCGNGGLDWNDVRPIMEGYLNKLPIKIYVYLSEYKDVTEEHNQPLEMENWIKENFDSIGFNFIKEDLKNKFKINNQILIDDFKLKYLSWEDDKLILYNGKEIIIKEEELCDFWNYIRDVGIIDVSRLPTRFMEYGSIMLDILNRLEYLDPIVIVDSNLDESQDKIGYQYAFYR